MKFLIVNTEAFSPKGVKKRAVTFNDFPWVVRKFLSVFRRQFIVLDESSKVKCNTPMKEIKKSARTRIIKLFNQTDSDRCIMTGTLMSKSPVNVIDQYEFLREGYFPENMYEFAENYCVMVTIRAGRGRRVLIGQKDYETIRGRLINAYKRGGELQLRVTMGYILRQYVISHEKQEHIIRHKEYTPFLNKAELIKRIAPDTIFVRREHIFDIKYDKFVKEPIMRPVELSSGAKKIGNELVDLGFTDNFTLGRAAALELQLRLQDVCNGFEPVKESEDDPVTYRPFKENVKIDALMELLEEIDVGKNQIVVWSSRTPLLRACTDAFGVSGIPYVVYDGNAKEGDKKEAKRKFANREAQIFLANQASGAYGLNCLADCSYLVWLCIDGSVEKYYQAMHRILRGQLHAPKFAYVIYAKGSIEERQWEKIRVGQELIGSENRKEIFEFK